MIDFAISGTKFDPFIVGIDRSQLRLFAKAIGETDPISSDAEAARSSGHPDVVVPPTFLAGPASENTAFFDLLIRSGGSLERLLHGEQHFTYSSLAHAGDQLRFTQRIGHVHRKRGGALEFIVQETDIVKDASGESVASLSSVIISSNSEMAL